MARILAKYIKDNKLQVRIIPNSGRNEILGWDSSRKELKIKINAPPEKNKANTELLKFLKKELKRPVELIKGNKSRTKTVLVH
ncbi:YggU family protein [Candidatus Woesearchaeota archaeon]|nr:YggU family protein [Candidatus Woesearchaeota archaeon]